MGRVYRAFDTSRQCAVAAKVMRNDLATQPALMEQFVAEGNLAAAIDHPHVVHLLDAFQINRQHVLVFEFVNGVSLFQYMNHFGPLHGSQFRHMSSQLADALAAIHQHNVVHGDVKSSNVMLSAIAGNCDVKLIDFGLAHRIAPAPPLPSEICGTEHYMAPELLLGDGSTPASDQYALGALFYEMISGEVPFATQSDRKAFRAQIHDSPPPPSSLRPTGESVPATVDDLILKMLAKNPSDRLASVSAVQRALAAIAPWGWTVPLQQITDAGITSETGTTIPNHGAVRNRRTATTVATR